MMRRTAIVLLLVVLILALWVCGVLYGLSAVALHWLDSRIAALLEKL